MHTTIATLDPEQAASSRSVHRSIRPVPSSRRFRRARLPTQSPMAGAPGSKTPPKHTLR
jgi:hypothetical protein